MLRFAGQFNPYHNKNMTENSNQVRNRKMSIDLETYHKKAFDHKRQEHGALNLTDLILACPKDEFIIRVYDQESDGYVFQIPIDLLSQVKTRLDYFFSPNEEHYSVKVVSCADDNALLRRICGELGA